MRQHHLRVPGRRRSLFAALLLVSSALVTLGATGPQPQRAPEPRPLGELVPAPSSAVPGGAPYELTRSTGIKAEGGEEARKVAEQLAGLLRPATGLPLPVTDGAAPDSPDKNKNTAHNRGGSEGILLRLDPSAGELGPEGYRLTSSAKAVVLTAPKAAGLFHGVQTLRQLLPASIEKGTVQPGPWLVAGGTVEDVPRFGHRGVMLDLARHFFTVEQVKRYLDQAALYKVNKLHLHLTDDQGWRIAVDSWPRLATYGGSTQVGGGEGGYWTKDDYRAVVRHAAALHMDVIPEIDMPGHTNAALASYAELNCDGKAPPLYTGTDVGFSSLCADKEVTYDFAEDVIGEIAELTPGDTLHIGGDEARSTSPEDYAAFMNRVQPLVGKYGKKVYAWHQLAEATPVKGATLQYWGLDGTPEEEKQRVVDAARAGAKVVLSPADRAYLDMKYDESTPLGLDWAGLVEVRRSYDWDPGAYLPGLAESSVAGVEAPMWTETLSTSAHLEFMAFPRLPGIAELGWSPASTHDWEGYRERLAAQGPRWEAMGVDFHRSPQVDWDGG